MKRIGILMLGVLFCFAVAAWPQAQPQCTNKIITFDAPGEGTGAGQGTSAVDINLKGMIIGYYLDAGNVYHSFLRDADGQFTTIDPPGADTTDAHYGSEAISMNQQGAITGFYVDENTVYRGFLRDAAGHFTTIDAPGADLTPGKGNGTLALNINQEGASRRRQCCK